MKLSVIIPTLNEAAYVAQAVASARDGSTRSEPPEILVADCGSTDGTADVARRLGVRVVEDAALDCRAAAVNFGAGHATGDVLVALDADSVLPKGYDAAIEQALRDRRVVGGAFEFGFDGKGFWTRIAEFCNRVRYRIVPRYFGDQAIFVRASAFREVGGYPRMKVMEAAALCDRLRRMGKLRLVRDVTRTSMRRFDAGGFWRVMWRDFVIWTRYLTGRCLEAEGEAYVADNQQRGQQREPATR